MPGFKNVDELKKACKYQSNDLNARDAVRKNMGYTYMNAAEKAKYDSVLDKMNPGKIRRAAYKKAGIHESATTREASVFCFYLMAKKNMSVKDAINFVPGVEGFDEALAEFNKFVDEHPVEDVSKEDQEKNVGEWADIYFAAAEKYNEYVFPDIDYSDPEEVRKHSYELSRVITLEIDYSQELDRMMGAGRKIYAEKKAGGADQLNKKRNLVEGSQYIMKGMLNAYMPETLNLNGSDLDKLIKTSAQQRIQFVLEIGPKIRGKSIKQVTEEASARSLYSIITMQNTTSPIKIETKDAYNYFVKEPTPEQTEQYKKQLAGFQDKARMSYNGTFQDATIGTFINDMTRYPLQENIGLEEVYAAEDNPAELVRIVASENSKNIRKAFHSSIEAVLEGANNQTLWDMLKIEKPINNIKIGGKTPEELWGDKVKGLKTQADKDTYYKAMIFKEAAKGDKAITIDQYLIDKQLKIKKTTVTVVNDNIGRERKLAFFKGINSTFKKLNAFKETLKETGLNGSPSYTAMLTALNKCLDATDLNGKANVSPNKLMDHMKELEKAAKAYYKGHTGIRGAFKAHYDPGKARLGVSKDLKDGIGYEIERIKDLAVGLDVFYDTRYFAQDDVDRRMELKKQWDRFKAETKLRVDSPRMGLKNLDDNSINAPEAVADHLEGLSNQKMDMRKQLDAAMKTISAGENFEMGVGSIFSNVPTLAKKYVYKEFNNMLRGAGTGPQSTSFATLEKIFEKDKFVKTFHEKVDELIFNDNFRELAVKDPKTCVTRWTKMVRKDPNILHQKGAEAPVANEHHNEVKKVDTAVKKK